MTAYDTFDDLAKYVDELTGGSGLNLLIHNAGLWSTLTLGELTPDVMLLHYETNTLGPLLLSQVSYVEAHTSSTGFSVDCDMELPF